MKFKFSSVADLNEAFGGRKIIVTGHHEWEGEHCQFVAMVYKKDHLVANPDDKPSANLVMKVKTSFGTDLFLEPKHAFIVEKEIKQQANKN